ncbi:hypothetical protein DFH06DRAFT_1150307 [Mycena polygramma]|nr:hypothetical protein DFH06DRAFT_1150307 [Mycena polygramma]
MLQAWVKLARQLLALEMAPVAQRKSKNVQRALPAPHFLASESQEKVERKSGTDPGISRLIDRINHLPRFGITTVEPFNHATLGISLAIDEHISQEDVFVILLYVPGSLALYRPGPNQLNRHPLVHHAVVNVNWFVQSSACSVSGESSAYGQLKFSYKPRDMRWHSLNRD